MVLLTKIKIRDSIKTKNPRIRKLVIETDDPDEQRLLDIYGNRMIGKYLPISNMNDHRANINNFLTELVLNMTLKHPNCNSCIGVLNDGKNIILIFKPIQYDLEHCRTRSFREIKSSIKDLVYAVKYLHSKRILHGDIKPSNVLTGSSASVKLSDYGHSSFILSGDKSTFYQKTYTRNYRAPEVWMTDTWGFSADIWALGCTIYYMIYNQHLFPEQESDECYISCVESWCKREKNTNGEPYELASEWMNPEYFTMNNLILRMCNPDESKRPSIFDISKQLEDECEYDLPISCSPDSVCKYIEIIKCDCICNCVYDSSTFVSPAKDTIIPLLEGKSIEYGSLILMLYEMLSCEPEYDKELFELSECVASKLTRQPISFTLTSRHVARLKEYICHGYYDFFNWVRYYGIVP